ncbi:glycosyltransferase family A protein [Bacteroides sp.]|uniref:glycosyltransferase family 2 protein n=1 Tax=Bacteroides sp. TaxID=29523 RepID=UPI002FC82120
MNPILSIVVPTKNRYIYLMELVKLFLKLDYLNIELVIQDNSDDNNLFSQFIANQSDDRIKYYYENKHLDIVQNANLAIQNSSGEYVCFIGDDDGFSSSIIDCVIWLKENSIDSLVLFNPVYTWPDVKSKIFNFSSSLKLDSYSGVFTEISPQNELRKVLNKGGTSLEKMPRVYQGIVSRKSLDKLYMATGSFFPGPCPDISNAVGLCFFVNKCYYLDYPVIVSGQGKKSGAGLGAQHKHQGEIESLSFLPKRTATLWENDIPKVWTGETIWAESCVKALRNTGHEEFISSLNLNRLYAKFLIFNPKYYKCLIKMNNEIVLHKLIYYCFLLFNERLCAFVRNFLVIKLGIRTQGLVYNFRTIGDVFDYLNIHFHSINSTQKK